MVRVVLLYVELFIYITLFKGLFSFFLAEGFHLDTLSNPTDLLYSLSEAGVIHWVVRQSYMSALATESDRFLTWSVGFGSLLAIGLIVTLLTTSTVAWPNWGAARAVWYQIWLYGLMMVPIALWVMPIGEFIWLRGYRDVVNVKSSHPYPA